MNGLKFDFRAFDAAARTHVCARPDDAGTTITAISWSDVKIKFLHIGTPAYTLELLSHDISVEDTTEIRLQQTSRVSLGHLIKGTGNGNT